MKQFIWGILLFLILAFFYKRNSFSSIITNKSSKDSSLLEPKNKSIDSLSFEEIRARYINNPCYLALLKDSSMWQAGTKVGYDYNDLLNDSLPSQNPYRNRFIVGDFNSLRIDGKNSGIYEVYPSLTSIKEFNSFPKSLLQRIDTTIYKEDNLKVIYADIKSQYGPKADKLINFIEKVWRYKIIPISREYSINGNNVYSAGQVLVLCEACKDTLKLIGKFATSAKRQDFKFEKDSSGKEIKTPIEYVPTGPRRGYYAGLNRITSKNWESERTYDSLDIDRDNELGGGNNRITIFDKKVELPNFLLIEPDKSYPKSMRRNGIHEIALNYLPRGMLGTPNSIG